ncbi:hypothetical protein EVAR_96258_1 [Eumeta japonica]|uniref:Uncharacterized protein n=1 Tax=Eumeta variegata TaxID=151549 RepID=A0A4C1WNL4_EUMVA|nr:hypothetical protein EVAR_96258_1 [Eumeta japonica]
MQRGGTYCMSLRRVGRCDYFGCELTRKTSVVTSLPEMPPLKKKTTADYDCFPLLFAKKAIRAASLEEWQKRYTEGRTGEITKCFFPRVKEAYGILQRVRMTPLLREPSWDTANSLSTYTDCSWRIRCTAHAPRSRFRIYCTFWKIVLFF